MALYYGLADVALLGGSFEPLGGQNLIEAAACGCPVVMGPSTFNFAEAAELSLAAGASMRVENMEQAVRGRRWRWSPIRRGARRWRRPRRHSPRRTAVRRSARRRRCWRWRRRAARRRRRRTARAEPRCRHEPPASPALHGVPGRDGTAGARRLSALGAGTGRA